jgi:alpha-D-ribose 1-methylphosphonate 5-triphosphate synthase subunit PhnH
VVLAGLADPVLDSQRIFRSVLEAMAHPGRVVALGGLPEAPRGLHPAAVALCLTLVDFETPLWLDPPARRPEVLDGLRFRCGCPIVEEPGRARFGLIVDPQQMPPLEAFDGGTDDYPDRSATLVVQVGALVAGAGKRLRGPGIPEEARLEAEGLPGRFWTELSDNRARFPRGVDVVLAAPAALAALPRTTRVQE